MPTSMNLNSLNSDVTISTDFFRSSQAGGNGAHAVHPADVFLGGERSRGELHGSFARVASSPLAFSQRRYSQHILQRATRLPAWPDCNLRGTLSAGAASRLPAFIAFVNGKCDETGIDLSAKPGCSAERVENNDNEWIDDFVARPDWRLEQPCSESETTAIKRLLATAQYDLMYPEKNRPMLLFTRTVCLPPLRPQIALRPLCGGKWTNSPRHHRTPNVVKMCC
ncbi:hypothetical protein HFO97_14305 [Rhizobium leguminosarum]|nr:hypothetical protein [Rhizobium leguminosarum]